VGIALQSIDEQMEIIVRPIDSRKLDAKRRRRFGVLER
jgi:hypothetical protein